MTAISLRDLVGMTEFAAAEALQRDVWGAGDKEDPADLMMVIAAEGGLGAGAFQGAHLLGYVFGFPTRKPGVQHSHRLAVRAEARGTGLGLALKWYQRDWCLARGITMVRWTYDPLRAVNAGLNIHRLGHGPAPTVATITGRWPGSIRVRPRTGCWSSGRSTRIRLPPALPVGPALHPTPLPAPGGSRFPPILQHSCAPTPRPP